MVTAVILAAGASTRMGFPKALADIRGRPLLERHLASFQGAADEIVVVLGCHEEVIRAGCDLGTARVVVNHRWTDGQASSIQRGLMAAAAGSSILLTPVDCAPPSPAVLEALLAARGEGAAAIIPTCGGRGGHPVWLAPETRDLLVAPAAPPRLDHALASLGEAARRVEVGDAGILENINNIKDLDRFLAEIPAAGDRG